MNIRRRAFSNFGWSAIGEALGKAVGFIATIYLAKTLGVDSFGLFSLAQLIVFNLWLVVDLGTGMYAIREIAKNRENVSTIANPILTLRIVFGGLLFAIYILFFLLAETSIAYKLTFIGCGLYLITNTIFVDWVLKGLEKFGLIVFGRLVSSVIFLLGIYFFVDNESGVIAASFIWSISFAIGGVSIFWALVKRTSYKPKLCWQWERWLVPIKGSYHFAISSGLLVFYQMVPILSLGILYSTYDVGLFAGPYKIITTASSAVMMLPMALYPILSELYKKYRVDYFRVHTKFIWLVIVLGLPIGILGVIYADVVMISLLGEKYASGIFIFKILVWILPVNFIRYALSIAIVSAGFQKYMVYGNFIGSVTIMTIGVASIYLFSIEGAAISLLFVEIIVMIYLWYVFNWKVKNENK